MLRPGGSLLFIEHVRAGDAARGTRASAAGRARGRSSPAAAAATRDTLALLGAHFDVTDLSRHRWRGMPRIVQPLIAGRAA